jgi:hypothetical protein
LGGDPARSKVTLRDGGPHRSPQRVPCPVEPLTVAVQQEDGEVAAAERGPASGGVDGIAKPLYAPGRHEAANLHPKLIGRPADVREIHGDQRRRRGESNVACVDVNLENSRTLWKLTVIDRRRVGRELASNGGQLSCQTEFQAIAAAQIPTALLQCQVKDVRGNPEGGTLTRQAVSRERAARRRDSE